MNGRWLAGELMAVEDGMREADRRAEVQRQDAEVRGWLFALMILIVFVVLAA